jgi:nucleotide-binding universal stress UspA family protein
MTLADVEYPAHHNYSQARPELGDDMYKKVMWATDGSETADRALSHAKALAAESQAPLLAVYCEEFTIRHRGDGPAAGHRPDRGGHPRTHRGGGIAARRSDPAAAAHRSLPGAGRSPAP